MIEPQVLSSQARALEVDVVEGGTVRRRRLLAAQLPRRVRERLLRLLATVDEQERPRP